MEPNAAEPKDQYMDIKNMDIKNIDDNYESDNDFFSEGSNLFQEEFLDMDNVIHNYNSLTSEFKLTTEYDIQFAKTIIEAVHNGCIPTANQID